MTAGPELPGKHVVLVPVTAEHVPDLRRILHTPEVVRWVCCAATSATPTAPGGMTACSWTSSPRNWTSLADSASLSRQRIGQRDGRLLWERSFRYPLRCHRAVEILRRFNAPEGVAHTMAETVADRAVSEAAAHPSPLPVLR
ncbi:MAG TPA: hypothetical protein VGO16_01155 [Pseudonocardiaceae bacterium]|jgi:hypothetical protein|nr:hypothetical protein [Pseudonocardiaceae bacterium]